MKIQRPLLTLCVSAAAFTFPSLLFAAAAPDAAATGIAPSAASNAATPASTAVASQEGSLVSGIQLETQVKLFQQINGLNLTPTQIEDILSRIIQLDKANRIVNARKATALRPVTAQLNHIHAALLAGTTPNAADQAAVDAALAPLKTLEDQDDQFWKDTAAAIRQDLSPEQAQLVRVDLGLEAPAPAGQMAANNTPVGPGNAAPGGQPVAAAAPQTFGGGRGGGGFAGGPGGARPGGGGPGGGRGGFGGGQPATPQAALTRVLDRFRRIPQDRFDQMKGQITQGMAQRIGLDPNSPQFQTLSTNFMNQVTLARGLSDDDWKQQRDTIAGNLSQQLQAGGVNVQQIMTAGGGRGGRMGQMLAQAQGAVDDDAIRKFFLQADTLRFLQSKVAHATATPTTGAAAPAQ